MPTSTVDTTLPINYKTEPSFTSLHHINTERIVTISLLYHPYWHRNREKIADMHAVEILSLDFWLDFIDAYIQRIKSYVASSASSVMLKNMQRRLVEAEEEMAEEFVAHNYSLFAIDTGREEEYFFRSLLGLLCTIVCELFKSDLCNSRSSIIL